MTSLIDVAGDSQMRLQLVILTDCSLIWLDLVLPKFNDIHVCKPIARLLELSGADYHDDHAEKY
jgi:DNA-binding response OmpR family regulator